ncbi:hypothetical protein [Streptomyces sp. I05A-00742]|uniref:hypothetical protein n=1 Tax=Streptomyces sp. I05A-00742 TaxID=2732853 RepID=UPI001488646B|nr:hypothetical protein [Streptomyces sp. I05A-00742]
MRGIGQHPQQTSHNVRIVVRERRQKTAIDLALRRITTSGQHDTTGSTPDPGGHRHSTAGHVNPVSPWAVGYGETRRTQPRCHGPVLHPHPGHILSLASRTKATDPAPRHVVINDSHRM